MKHLILLGTFLLLFSATGSAETYYITNDIKVNVRTGTGTQYNIIAMLKPGEPVELIKRGTEWSQIKLNDGRGGWILTRFITSSEPNYLELERLRKLHKALATRFPIILEENKEVRQESKNLTKKLNTYQKQNKELLKSYNKLKDEAAGFLKLRENYDETALRLSEHTEQIEKLNKELTRKYITAGLCGAGILLVGFIIGFSTKRQRRKTSLF